MWGDRSENGRYCVSCYELFVVKGCRKTQSPVDCRYFTRIEQHTDELFMKHMKYMKILYMKCSKYRTYTQSKAKRTKYANLSVVPLSRSLHTQTCWVDAGIGWEATERRKREREKEWGTHMSKHRCKHRRKKTLTGESRPFQVKRYGFMTRTYETERERLWNRHCANPVF